MPEPETLLSLPYPGISVPFIDYDDKRILFIHIPKAGGTSVEAWLESLGPLRFHAVGPPLSMRCSPQHLRRSDFEQLFGRGYFDYAFTITRNPYTRLESEYRMQMRQRDRQFFRRRPSFQQWLERNLEIAARDPWHGDNHFRPQWEFLGDGLDRFQLEQGLETALAQVAAKLGLPAPPAPERLLDTRSGAQEPIVWDEVDRIRVQERYGRDFEHLGYER